MSSKVLQIALADDHHVVLDGLKSLLETTGHYKVPITAANGLDLITQLKTKKTLPDVCILDVSMGPLNGYETVLVIKKKWPQIKILMLSMFDDELLITRLLEAGASSYIPKNTHYEILHEAISIVVQKGYYHTDAVAKILFQKAGHKNTMPDITEKELRFLCLCCSDIGYKEIADKMGIKERTVDNYRDSLFQKLNKHTRSGLAVFATTSGIRYLSTEYLSASGLLN